MTSLGFDSLTKKTLYILIEFKVENLVYDNSTLSVIVQSNNVILR